MKQLPFDLEPEQSRLSEGTADNQAAKPVGVPDTTKEMSEGTAVGETAADALADGYDFR